jgi:very-short-patch-repair endonuclease
MVVGDPRQLRHISRLGALAERRLLQRHQLITLDTQRFGHGQNSCFDLAATIAEPLLLDRHYRSHSSIIERASRAFYQGRLQVATDEERLTRHGAAWQWIDTVGPLTAMPSGVSSAAECEAIVALLLDLQQQNFTGTIGVAAPFRAQVELLDRQIRSALDPVFCQKSRLLVATAHGFQGDERDAVAFSLCAGPDLPPGSAHFLSSTPNLLNVALTRARSLLAVVGNRTWAKEQGPIFLRRLAAEPEPEPAIPAANPYESPAEARLAKALEEAGMSTTPQHPIAGRRLDLAIPDLHLDIEVDGTATHRSITGHRLDDDVWRDRVLIRRGWTILRFWTFELDRDLPACVAKVQAEVDRLRRVGRSA